MFTSCRCGLKIHYWCKNKKIADNICSCTNYILSLSCECIMMYWILICELENCQFFFVSCIARVYFAHIVFCCFFVCLLVCGFSSHLRSFHSYENVTIADVGLKIFTYSPHSWPLNSDGSLAYQTYCDTGHPFICHLRGHVTLTIIAERLAVKLSFYDLDLSRLRLEHPTFR